MKRINYFCVLLTLSISSGLLSMERASMAVDTPPSHVSTNNQQIITTIKNVLAQTEIDRRHPIIKKEKKETLGNLIEPLQKGADINTTEFRSRFFGRAPLLICVLMEATFDHSFYEIAKSALHNGANPNVIYEDTSTPLILVAHALNAHTVEITRLLLENDADVHYRNCNGETALDLALKTLQTKKFTDSRCDAAAIRGYAQQIVDMLQAKGHASPAGPNYNNCG